MFLSIKTTDSQISSLQMAIISIQKREDSDALERPSPNRVVSK
jgi:hypothetical protein